VEFKGRHLINFVRSTEFSIRMKKLLQYKGPKSSQLNPSAGSLAYLESQLRDISVNPSTEDVLEERSIALAADEKRIHDLRVREFRSLGFRA
jgi:hypothetical protein